MLVRPDGTVVIGQPEGYGNECLLAPEEADKRDRISKIRKKEKSRYERSRNRKPNYTLPEARSGRA
jgi:hypothetical protein